MSCVKHITSHEKDTTVAWGYHKDVIIDIIIKAIIIHNSFIIYNYFEWWKHLSVDILYWSIYIHSSIIPLCITMNSLIHGSVVLSTMVEKIQGSYR